MKISIETNIPSIQKQLQEIAQKKLPSATRRTVNDLAFMVRSNTYSEMTRVFDRPKPGFTLKSMEVIKAASQGTPSAWVGLRLERRFEKALSHQFTGGTRAWKRMEGAFMRIGIMPQGTIAVPGKAAPLDQYGNIVPSFIVRLMSYLSAFGESGYKANMTQKKKDRLGKKKKSSDGFMKINGVEYFVSYGKKQAKTRHLAPGIYSRTGTGGADIKPILMFVRSARYEKRIDLQKIGRLTVSNNAHSLLALNLSKAVAGAVGDKL